MKAILYLAVILALLFGTYVVYKNMTGQLPEDHPLRIEAISKARDTAGRLESVQEKRHRRVQEAAK